MIVSKRPDAEAVAACRDLIRRWERKVKTFDGVAFCYSRARRNDLASEAKLAATNYWNRAAELRKALGYAPEEAVEP